MRNLISANFSRLFRSKIYWIGMLFQFGLAVVAVSVRFHDMQVSPEYAYPTADGLWFAGGMYLAIVLAVVISIWLGTDYSDGTIRNKLLVGHTRGEIYAANWVVCTVASLALHVIYIVVVAGLGCLLLEPFETPVRMLMLLSLASLATVVAFSSLFVFLAMLIHNKANGAVVALLTALVLLIGGAYMYSMLNAPEYIETNFEMNVNGELVQGEPIPNPAYLRGVKRQVFSFMVEFQPAGQMLLYGMMEEELPENLVFLPVYSLLITVLTSFGGYVFFRRKDLK